jgi:ribosomal protein L15E
MLVLMEEAAMHPYLLEELAAVRVQELRRETSFLRVTAPRRPSIARRAAARSLHSVGFWLVGAGLRLAVAGTDRRVGR